MTFVFCCRKNERLRRRKVSQHLTVIQLQTAQPVLPRLFSFHYIWSFSVLSGVLGFLLKIWDFFYSSLNIEMYVVLLYFPFKNTVFSKA